MFIGRERELALLQKVAGRQKASLVVCKGRRRIGKSTLIQQFARRLPLFWEFQGLAPRQGLKNQDQLDKFSQQMARQLVLPALQFKDWGEAFFLLAKQVPQKKTLIFFDEISWLAAQDQDFAGQLKITWDLHFKKHKNLLLVLCGSVSSWIEANILNSSDFMGRVSLTLTVEELPLHQCNQFWQKKPHVSAMEKLKLLAVTGGVPRYLEEIDVKASAEENIADLCFDPSGILFSEFDKIFNDIFSKKAKIYRHIVSSLVEGNKSFSQVCQIIGIQANGVISQYLDDLETSGFIARNFVYSLKSGNKGKLSRYRLRDNYLRFYLKYIEPRIEQLKKGVQLSDAIESFLSYESIMGLQFENLVHNNLPYLLEALRIPPATIISASPYFQNKTLRTEALQIDLLIQTKNTLYLCEIKFRKRITGPVIEEVRQKMTKLKAPKHLSLRPVLIYVGTLDSQVATSDFLIASSHLRFF